MNVEAAFAAIRRDLEALIKVMIAFKEKQDYLIDIIDRPAPEDNPIADALSRLASAVEKVSDNQQKLTAMGREILLRLPANHSS
jgi:hypothetical protein